MALLGGKKEDVKPEAPKLSLAEMEALHAKGTHKLEVIDGKVSFTELKPEKRVKVRFLKQGRLNGVRHDADEVREVPESHLEHYLAIGAAELHKPAPKAPPAPQVFIHKKAAER